MAERNPAKQRRLAAVLSADMAGYVRLMRMNEEGTHQRFMTCRAQILEPLIATHGGRVVKETGDGVLAEFGSAINAVRCALASQRELATLMAAAPVDERLAFRMGIAVGDVLVEGGDIYGDTVNLAVRLQGEADTGGVCVSRAVYEQTCEGLAGTARFETIGSRALKHVTDPIPAWRVQPAASSENGPTLRRASIWEGPAVCVLPFDVVGDSREDRWFADGFADDLITALGAWDWFAVIARQSSFIYRERGASAQQIARELGAGYLVEGTFRRDAERLRIAVRLVDGGSGRMVWGGRSEQSVGNFIESQDELLMEIGGALEAELARQERERASAASRAADVDAYLTLQRGLWHHYQRTPADNAEAQRLFREAIALDPGYAQAWAALARATYSAAWSGWTNAPPERGLEDAIALAREAVQIGPRCTEAWYALGDAHLVAQDLLDREHLLDESLSAFENAIALNPNHARARAKIAAPLASAARPEEAAKSVELALRLSPRDPMLEIWLPALALSHYVMGDYEAAVAVARRQVTLRPAYAPGYNYLAAGLARLGRREEAADAFDRLISLESDAVERMQRFTRTFRDRAMAEHVLEGLRLAASR